MATPQLLDAAIRSDGAVREAPYTLLCMVVAVERASAITWPPRSDGTDVMAIYSAERDVDPFERVLQAADECSLQRNKFKLKKRELKVQQEDEEGNLVPRMSSVHVQYDLERLLHSTSRLEARRRLEEQLEDLRLAQIRELTGVLLPKHLQITAVEEDPLEFRRDTHGIAQVWGRNVLGEHYAPTNDPLRFLHSHSVPELFQRMKRIVREDLSTRNKRRIASLNAKERARQQELQRQGILSQSSSSKQSSTDCSMQALQRRNEWFLWTDERRLLRVLKRRDPETVDNLACHCQVCSSAMAGGGWQYCANMHKHRRLQSACYRSDSRRSLDDVARVQSRQAGRYRLHNAMQFLLLLLAVFAAPILAATSASSIDYGSLTWSEWGEMYTRIATDASAPRRIYSTGPRVRAKIMVSTQISMSELEAGEAIFREQIRGIVEVETIDRVQLEYLQTDVPSEDEQGTYYVALGISALPPPLGSSGNSYASTDSSLVLPTIEIERERIVEKVRYGSILASGNVTIDSLSLFGGQMSLVDITMDGEAFTQVYLKPWVGVQLVIASTTSETTGVSTSDGDHYTTDRNAFQDLRLRFLLARRLRSVQVGVSDIIVHSPVALLPFDIFHADAGVLEIEIHVHDIQYAGVVESILIDDGSTPNATASNNLAATFNEMESQWQLIAMDVDTAAGELFSPAGGSSTSLATDNGDSGFVSELAFEMRNISMAQLERTKWSVLDFIRIEAAQITSGRVRFGHIVFPPSSYALSNLDIHNDGSDAGSIFDPINAINWTLNFLVESENSDSADLASHITDTQTFVEMGFQHALGFTADSSNSRSTTFKGAIDWVDPGWANADSVEPFVSFTLTIQLEPLGASGIILESPNFFQLHYVRCALVLLLQQVAIADNQVALISANAVDLPTVKLDKTGHTWHRLLFFKYRATISDESQRRGIRSVIFSHRLAATISHYSGSTLELVEREIDLHADGSPVWPKYLPGLLVAAPTANSTSDGFTTSSASQLGHQESFTYDFSDPQPNIASGILADATGLCPSTTSTNTSALCIKLHFTGSFQVAPIYLRTLHSLRPIESSTISLPPQHAALDAADSSTSYPAPWVLVGEQTVDEKTSWALQVGASPDAKTYSIRLTFAAVDTMQDLSATTPFTLDLEFNAEDVAVSPVVRRRQFGDLAVVSTIGQPAPAFITAEPPELVGDGTQTSVHITMDLQKPRLGGLYSVSLLNDVAPSCRDCTTAITDCNSILEGRAFSACASVLLDADLTLISTMLQTDATVISVDASWLLRDCLSPSDGTVWSSTVREMLLSSYTCLLENHCPLAYSVSVGKQLVLDYQHGEQVLTFELASGFASLSFMLDTDEDDSTTYEFVEDFSANATDVITQLNAMLTEMYRAALSNVATVESVLTTLEDPATGAVTAHLTIKYLFLGQLPLPFVHISKSGSTDATVETTVPNETLHLRPC